MKTCSYSRADVGDLGGEELLPIGERLELGRRERVDPSHCRKVPLESRLAPLQGLVLGGGGAVPGIHQRCWVLVLEALPEPLDQGFDVTALLPPPLLDDA